MNTRSTNDLHEGQFFLYGNNLCLAVRSFNGKDFMFYSFEEECLVSIHGNGVDVVPVEASITISKQWELEE